MAKRKGIGQQVEEAVKGGLPAPSAIDLPTLGEAQRLIALAVKDGNTQALLDMRDVQAARERLWARREGGRMTANEAGAIKVAAERGLGQIDLRERPHGGARQKQVRGTPNLKRIAALNAVEGGWLYPALTVQAYLEAKARGPVLAVAIIETRQLYRYLLGCVQPGDALTPNNWYGGPNGRRCQARQVKGTTFLAVYWKDLDRYCPSLWVTNTEWAPAGNTGTP